MIKKHINQELKFSHTSARGERADSTPVTIMSATLFGIVPDNICRLKESEQNQVSLGEKH